MKQERVSTSTNTTGNSTRSLESLRSRYHAFLEKRKSPKPPSRFARFGQGLLSFAIFFGLFVAILTVFGLGLSWYSRADSQKGEAASGKPAITEASASMLPAPSQPAGPAGHAEVKAEPATKKKTDGK